VPEPVAHLLDLVRLKTEAGALGYEAISARDGEVILRLRRSAPVDRVGLYKRFRNEARVLPGEVRIPRRQFATESDAWLHQLRELLPAVVGHKPRTAAQASVAGADGAGATPDLARPR
jgi:hypothetical protein